MNFLEAPAPREALSPADVQRGLELRPSLGEYVGASASEGFWSTGLGQVMAGARVERAATIGTLDPAENAPLAEPDWKTSEFHREGVSYRPGMTRATARALAEIKDENDARRRLIGARDADAGDMVLGFGAGVLGAIATPENFIPFAGPALAAARTARFGAWLTRLGTAAETARAGTIGARAVVGGATGATDAFLGNLLAMPLVHGSRQDFGDDITWADVVQDLALGTVGGAVLGSALHAALPRAPLPEATQDASLRALTGAAAQVANGEAVDFSAANAALRAEIASLRALNEEARAAMSVSGQAASRELVPSGRVAPGAETRATTPAGTDVTVRYEVVEAADLVASHRLPDFTENPAFAGELQPRDRSTAERQQQVRGIAARLRPEELEASPHTTTGAPIVGPDGLVESGNGRVLAIATAYQDGLPTAQSYRAMLEQAGFDQAATMREPVLIRRRVSELDQAGRVRFVNESNIDTIDALTPGEQARVDAQAITPQVLALVRNQDLTAAANAEMQRAFIASLPGREQRALSRDGALTPDGITRLRRAMAARAYDDPALITRLTETADGAAEAIGRGMMDAAPAIAALRAARDAGQLRPELDATDALMRAARRIQQVRDANLPIRAALDQMDLFGADAGAAERAFLDLLLRHPNRQQLGGVGRETIADRLAAYARHAREAPNEPDMFGAAPPGLGDVLAAAFRDAGLEPPAQLRSLRADGYSPPAQDVPEPPPPPGQVHVGEVLNAQQATSDLLSQRRRAAGFLWRMTPEELAQAAERGALDDATAIERAFGPDGAERLRRLERAQNSSNPERVEAAAREMTDWEKSWTPEQRRAAYGEGETAPTAEDYRSVLDGHQVWTEHDNNAQIARFMSIAVTRFKPDQLRAILAGEGSVDQQAQFVTLAEGWKELQRRGEAENAITEQIFGALRDRGVSQNDADYFLRGFLNAMAEMRNPPPPPAPQRIEAPPPALPAPAAGRPSAEPVSRVAAQAGLDVEAGAARADVQRLADAGRLDAELAAEIRAADELAAKTENAADAWQAAVSCAMGR